MLLGNRDSDSLNTLKISSFKVMLHEQFKVLSEPNSDLASLIR